MKRRLRRIALAGLAVLCVAPVLTVSRASGMPAHRAGVIVQHSDLGTLTDCVTFTEPEIDGITLLERSEFDYRSARFPEGRGVCWLDGEGCKTSDPDECFCTPAFGVTGSWSYFVQEREDPVFDHGDSYPSERVIHDGSMDYWTFGPHGMPPMQPRTFDEVCA